MTRPKRTIHHINMRDSAPATVGTLSARICDPDRDLTSPSKTFGQRLECASLPLPAPPEEVTTRRAGRGEHVRALQARDPCSIAPLEQVPNSAAQFATGLNRTLR